MSENIRKARLYIQSNGVGIAIEVLVNFVAPFLIYEFAKRSLGDVNALIASSGPPIAWSLVEFVRKRHVDAVSMLVLAGIALSLLAFLGGGSARFLQLREKLVTALIGVAFLGSAVIGKPLIYELARATMLRRSASEAASFEALKTNVHFRRTMTLMTVVWGLGLVGEAVITGALVLTMSIGAYLVVSPIIGYGTMAALGLWTFWYGRHQRRRGEARRAAEARAAEASLNPPAASP